MSWSVTASGTPTDVLKELERQFAHPLADGNAGLPNEDEKETVRKVRDMIYQCVATFDAGATVSVSANGHMGYTLPHQQGAYQQVNVTIK